MSKDIRFGTDGVRGPADQWPIDAVGAERIGAGIAAWTNSGTVLVGRDTRESGERLEKHLIQGLVAGGSKVQRLGVVPTAAVSAAVFAQSEAQAGIMITASHNAWKDNGIKVVDENGEKLLNPNALVSHFSDPPRNGQGTVLAHPNPLAAWRSHLPTVDLHGWRILVDAAHGACAVAAPEALRQAGAEVVTVGCTPDGRNINAGVGAMHPPVDIQDCDLAICLDGDGDRLVMVHPHHGTLDGDDLLWMLSRDTKDTVVGTVMTNGGLEKALQGRLVRTAVGDAKVWAEMLRIGSPLGGEPSGHIMLRDGMPTSDGLYTAMRILAKSKNHTLPIDGWNRRPQTLKNVRNAKPDTNLVEIREAENNGCRVLVRASGTEPLVRIMVEGPACETWAERIAGALPPI